VAPSGWIAHCIVGNKRREFTVAIADIEAAETAVRSRCPAVGRVLMLPLRGGEFERLGLAAGQIIEASPSTYPESPPRG
jgi:hypothetical protein